MHLEKIEGVVEQGGELTHSLLCSVNNRRSNVVNTSTCIFASEACDDVQHGFLNWRAATGQTLGVPCSLVSSLGFVSFEDLE